MLRRAGIIVPAAEYRAMRFFEWNVLLLLKLRESFCALLPFYNDERHLALRLLKISILVKLTFIINETINKNIINQHINEN